MSCNTSSTTVWEISAQLQLSIISGTHVNQILNLKKQNYLSLDTQALDGIGGKPDVQIRRNCHPGWISG